MKLKRITLVCIGVCGAPAIATAQSLTVSAPTSSVQIYGTINVDGLLNAQRYELLLMARRSARRSRSCPRSSFGSGRTNSKRNWPGTWS